LSAVAAPSDKRFRRAHVKPTRRHRWRGAMFALARSLAVLAAVLFAAYRGSSMLAHARVLQIDQIVVTGNERLGKGDVLAVLDGLKGESLVSANLEVWRRRLLASPWVKEAALRRALPSTVEVTIAERKPIALARIKGSLYLVDERGLVIDEYGARYADLDLPIVDGLAPAGAGRQEADEVRADLVVRLLGAVASDPQIAKRVSQIDVSDPHNAALILSGDPALIYVGDDRFLARLESYQQLASTLRERVADIDYVDLRFDDRIYVRPAFAPKGASAGKPAGRRG
jgi:cell division protein FtsQ